MRRPHPRFDAARNAWVTRAGGRLKTLAQGPENPQTEAAAWDAFYAHMAKLGNPVENANLSAIALGQLADKYGEWMEREVEAGLLKLRTLTYYRHQLQKFLDALGGRRPAAGVLPHDVEMFKTGAGRPGRPACRRPGFCWLLAVLGSKPELRSLADQVDGHLAGPPAFE